MYECRRSVSLVAGGGVNGGVKAGDRRRPVQPRGGGRATIRRSVRTTTARGLKSSQVRSGQVRPGQVKPVPRSEARHANVRGVRHIHREGRLIDGSDTRPDRVGLRIVLDSEHLCTRNDTNGRVCTALCGSACGAHSVSNGQLPRGLRREQHEAARDDGARLSEICMAGSPSRSVCTGGAPTQRWCGGTRGRLSTSTPIPTARWASTCQTGQVVSDGGCGGHVVAVWRFISGMHVCTPPPPIRPDHRRGLDHRSTHQHRANISIERASAELG
jgi:hypothetical protein